MNRALDWATGLCEPRFNKWKLKESWVQSFVSMFRCFRVSFRCLVMLTHSGPHFVSKEYQYDKEYNSTSPMESTRSVYWPTFSMATNCSILFSSCFSLGRKVKETFLVGWMTGWTSGIISIWCSPSNSPCGSMLLVGSYRNTSKESCDVQMWGSASDFNCPHISGIRRRVFAPWSITRTCCKLQLLLLRWDKEMWWLVVSRFSSLILKLPYTVEIAVSTYASCLQHFPLDLAWIH